MSEKKKKRGSRLVRRVIAIVTLALAIILADIFSPYIKNWVYALLPRVDYQSAAVQLTHEMEKAGELIAVRNRNTLEALSRCKTAGAAVLAQAACAVVVLGDTLRSDVWIEDTSIVMAYMQLQAVDLGIGSCWVNYFAPTEIAKAFNLPDNEQLLLLMPLGYAAEDAKPAPLHEASRDIKEMVQYL